MFAEKPERMDPVLSCQSHLFDTEGFQLSLWQCMIPSESLQSNTGLSCYYGKALFCTGQTCGREEGLYYVVSLRVLSSDPQTPSMKTTSLSFWNRSFGQRRGLPVPFSPTAFSAIRGLCPGSGVVRSCGLGFEKSSGVLWAPFLSPGRANAPRQRTKQLSLQQPVNSRLLTCDTSHA